MARVTFVKAAQQRYKTVPVIDPETGKQKVTAVTRKDGTPKMTRAKPNRPARPITMKVTEADKSQPLPLLTCDYSGCKHEDRKIQIGTPYKHITPKSGPYGGRQRSRHADCPSWQVWEYSSSLSARLAEISHNFQMAVVDVESSDDVTSALSEAAEAVREIAQEKQDGADNIEQGFGHETSQSEELRSTGESLESWADEIEQVDVPEYPEAEGSTWVVLWAKDNTEVSGEEHETEEAAQEEIDELVVDPEADNTEDDFTIDERENEEPTEQQIADWRDEVESVCSIVDESPV